MLSLLTMAAMLVSHTAIGQVEVTGTVYDRSQLFVMPGVSVLGTSGKGTMTDSVGHYRIRLAAGDSIYFSYLGKFTHKYPVKNVLPGYPLDISLMVRIDSLPLVVVKPRLYRYDSLANRDEYRRAFDYQPDDYVVAGSDGGVGLNLDMLFGARKNRQMLALQRRLIEEEQDKYVEHRFNKTLVRKITGLQRPALDSFMRLYRPTYAFIQNFDNDYDYYKYIKDAALYFMEIWRRDHLF